MYNNNNEKLFLNKKVLFGFRWDQSWEEAEDLGRPA